MTHDEVHAIKKRWENDAGVAAKDVVRLCDEIYILRRFIGDVTWTLKGVLKSGDNNGW
jgi:hypothetical protein